MLIHASTHSISSSSDSVLQLYFRGTRQYYFQTADLVFLQGDGNYTWLHWRNRPAIIMPKTLKQLAAILPDRGFVRIHRNSIVNCEYVKSLQRSKGGAGTLYLVDGTALPISRRRWEVIADLLGGAKN